MTGDPPLLLTTKTNVRKPRPPPGVRPIGCSRGRSPWRQQVLVCCTTNRWMCIEVYLRRRGGVSRPGHDGPPHSSSILDATFVSIPVISNVILATHTRKVRLLTIHLNTSPHMEKRWRGPWQTILSLEANTRPSSRFAGRITAHLGPRQRRPSRVQVRECLLFAFL